MSADELPERNVSDSPPATAPAVPPPALEPPTPPRAFPRPKEATGTLPLPPDRFHNRELSWLSFNERVLEEALDPTVPLLERLKFLAIMSSNLDEFFMVRVAGLKRQIEAGVNERYPDGRTPRQVFLEVAERCVSLVQRQHDCFLTELGPRLDKEGIRILHPEQLNARQREFVREYFRKTILPVVTPLAIDPGHPFPYLSNRTICLTVQLLPRGDDEGGTRLALVHIPSSVLPRFLRLPAEVGQHEFILLEDVVRANIDSLFNGYEVRSCCGTRVTRDWDLVIEEDGVHDLLKTIEEGIRARRKGAPVRLQYDDNLPPEVLEILVRELELEREDLYPMTGFVGFADLLQLYLELDVARLKDPPCTPQRVPALDRTVTTFEAIKKSDILVHHPYQTFDYVVRFLREAAEDPNVLAIKMTLYRTGGGASPIVEALCRAARNGKQVAVLMELKARFDEQANIEGARRLEEAGVHVIYGLVGLKTHCKAALVVRREEGRIQRYVHLSTGNYNARTATIYVDYGLFTAREDLAEDITQVFNVITGYCKPPRFNHVTMAPWGLRERTVELIRRERDNAQNGREARIVAQMNAIVDPQVIDELYHAGRAGVRIELIVRGICAIRPGVAGLSENIRVVCVIDRFLEHARCLYFWNDGRPELYLSSADWMPRNLDRRIELLFPVLDPLIQSQVIESLEVTLRDEAKGWEIMPDGRSRRTARSEAKLLRSQMRRYDMACRVARETTT
jgi:polyphosphate kinase